MPSATFAILCSLNILCSGVIAVSNKAILGDGFHAIHLLTLHYLTGFTLTLCTEEDKCSTLALVREGHRPEGFASVTLSLATVLNLLLSQLSLKANSIFVFQIGRYLAIPFTAVGDVLFNGLKLSQQKCAGLLYILLGVSCVLTRTYKTEFVSVERNSNGVGGISFCVLGALAQAANAVGMNFILKHHDVTALMLLRHLSFYNSVFFIGGCVLAPLVGIDLIFRENCIPVLTISCTSAVMIQYTSLRITQDTSATFYTMMTIFKSATIALLGSVVLSESLEKAEYTTFVISSVGIVLFSTNDVHRDIGRFARLWTSLLVVLGLLISAWLLVKLLIL